MSSSFIRFRAGFSLFSVSVMIAVLTAHQAVGAAADEPASVEGPAIAASPDKTTKETDAAPAEKSAQADKTPTSEKKADQPEKKPDIAKEKSANVLGDPLAPGMVKLLQDEISTGIKRRGISDRFARFQRYMIGQVNHSAGKYTGSELAGNCRLRWYDHLMRNALAAPGEAERFTRDLHAAALDGNEGLAQVLAIESVKMDLGPRKPRKSAAPATADQALETIKQALTEAQVAYCAALAPLGKSEIRELQANLVSVFSTQNQVGHTLNDRGTGRRLCDLMEKMDRGALQSAAGALAPIADQRLLEQLKNLPSDGKVKVAGVTGAVARIDTPSGAIIVGGRGPNTYQLDQMSDVAAVIDLGGNDVYHEGTVDTDRPVLVVVDLAGNDSYRGVRPGIQGGAVLGVSMLLDLAGDDVYQAQDVAQGSVLAGVGILIDYAGNDRYVGVRRVQGQANGGIGLLIDRAGKDDYRAAMWAQGFGGPLGFGLLDDLSGDDHYFCGGLWRDSYPETPGMEGWGQGVGAGIRQVANGGIGAILDGAGDDVYEFDYLAHGGGYWCGVGFARDFGGNDQRLITKTAYNGGQRIEPSFQRFGCGWGCHYSQGFMFDDVGNDVYEGTIMGTGMAWDCSAGFLFDLAGNDHYKATGGIVQGSGAQMSLGVLFDYNGDDVYDGYGQGYASPSISYHHLPECGGNFSFVVDYGGKDSYGCGAQDNSYTQRGDAGGFLIDRPRQDELDRTATAAKPKTTPGT